MRYVRAQLSSPSFVALSLLFSPVAALRLSFPCRMEHDSTDDANEHQANSTKYQVRPCSKAYQTRSERFVAGRCQEVQGAVREGLHIKGRQLLCVFPRRCGCGDFVYYIVERFIGSRGWRVRSRCNGIAHGGCVSACIGAGRNPRLSYDVRDFLATCKEDGRQQGETQVAPHSLAALLGSWSFHPRPRTGSALP